MGVRRLTPYHLRRYLRLMSEVESLREHMKSLRLVECAEAVEEVVAPVVIHNSSSGGVVLIGDHNTVHVVEGRPRRSGRRERAGVARGVVAGGGEGEGDDQD